MINPEQLRSLIKDTLEIILPEMNSPEAVELLMMTAAQESFCGTYLQQLHGGPALGIFQMEPVTYRCLFNNYLQYDPEIIHRLESFFTVHEGNFNIQMRGDIPYQIVIARLNYRRKPGNIPKAWETLQLAEYYKKYWNTHLGAATIPEVLHNYDKYAK